MKEMCKFQTNKKGKKNKETNTILLSQEKRKTLTEKMRQQKAKNKMVETRLNYK